MPMGTTPGSFSGTTMISADSPSSPRNGGIAAATADPYRQIDFIRSLDPAYRQVAVRFFVIEDTFRYAR